MGAEAIRNPVAQRVHQRREHPRNDNDDLHKQGIAIDRGELAMRSARFCLGLCLSLRLRSDRLIDLKVGHLEFAEQVEQQRIFFR